MNLHMAAMLAALLLFFSGCVALVERPADVEVVESGRQGSPPWAPAQGWRRKHETYHYHPTTQVFYYPSVRGYYWLEGSEWRYSDQFTRYDVLDQDKRAVLDVDYEPHTYHAKIRSTYPPDYDEWNHSNGKYK